MKKTTISLGGAALALAFTLSACGGDSAGSIASEACGLSEDMVEAAEDGGLEAIEDYSEDLEALQEKADDAGISDEDMEKAFEEECPDLAEQLP